MMGPLSGRGRGRRRAPMAEINVTPMVDVMLVLLIIFMVAAPLLVAGVPVNLPSSRANALTPEQKPIEMTVDGGGKLFIDDTLIAPTTLPERLVGIRAAAGDKPPQILLRADKKLPYGDVMTVMGELNRAGLNRVALVTTISGTQTPSRAEPADAAR